MKPGSAIVNTGSVADLLGIIGGYRGGYRLPDTSHAHCVNRQAAAEKG